MLEEYCQSCLTLPNPQINEFADRIVELAAEKGRLEAQLSSPSSIEFMLPGSLYRFESEDAKTLLRMVCARLVGAATEQGFTELNPYECEFKLTGNGGDDDPVQIKVHVTNTPDKQTFSLSAASPAGSPD